MHILKRYFIPIFFKNAFPYLFRLKETELIITVKIIPPLFGFREEDKRDKY
jgi:hypothetical protein